MEFNLPKGLVFVQDATTSQKDMDQFKAEVKDGIEIYLHENYDPQLCKIWETCSEQQLCHLVTQKAKIQADDQKYDPEDLWLVEISLADYIVNFLKAYATKHEITIEQALVIFYCTDISFTNKHIKIRTEIDPYDISVDENTPKI